MHEEITLSREVDAIQIPSGDIITLPAGTKVMITQALGGTYTVATSFGLARIKADNADALGIDLEAEKNKRTAVNEALASGDIEGAIWEQLKLVYDPEIPVNIVDLGLVYDTRISDLPEGGYRVDVKMTLTAQGCGMGTAIAGDAEDKLKSIPSVKDASVRVVWDPPWTAHMISDEGRKKLGIE
jgi:probable FeS assembly SUF system protein SufT